MLSQVQDDRIWEDIKCFKEIYEKFDRYNPINFIKDNIDISNKNILIISEDEKSFIFYMEFFLTKITKFQNNQNLDLKKYLLDPDTKPTESICE